MSKYNQPEEFWKNFVINNITIVKKIGERNFRSTQKNKEYYYITDILLAKCSCGFEYNVEAKSLLNNKSNSCRMCATKKEDNIGKTINNLLCTDSYHKRNGSGRSVIWLRVICQKCNTIKDVKADIFRFNECSCTNCSKKSSLKEIGNRRKPSRYFSKLKQGAKKRNIEVKITLEDILNLANKQNYKCSLSGIDISYDDGSLSVDRIDSKKGYLIDNIQCVHRDVNYMKCSYSQEHFINICTKVAILNKKI